MENLATILAGGESSFVEFKEGKYYIRAGSTSRECSKEELGRLFQRSRQVYFEETPVYETNEAHVDREKIQVLF
jgi:predicted HTH transcriptional regulator